MKLRVLTTLIALSMSACGQNSTPQSPNANPDGSRPVGDTNANGNETQKKPGQTADALPVTGPGEGTAPTHSDDSAQQPVAGDPSRPVENPPAPPETNPEQPSPADPSQPADPQQPAPTTPGEPTPPTAGEPVQAPTPRPAPTELDMFCPEGFYYLEANRLCVSDTTALGPFPKEMIAKCKKFGGGTEICESSTWGRDFAIGIRGTSVCPPGTFIDPSKGECTDGTNAFGPFIYKQVLACKSVGGGQSCEGMRWHKDFIPDLGTGGRINKTLFNYYSRWANYNRVSENVKTWYPYHRHNGCVAFMSTALRQIGINIPHRDTISLVTLPFSNYLSRNLGWRRINRVQDLRPGDVVFTQDLPSAPGYPAHTYMFHSWQDKKKLLAYVVDNQDFTHVRNMMESGTFNFTPFDYALRAP